jgi:CBS domain-containing protein
MDHRAECARRKTMNVNSLMRSDARWCSPSTSLAEAGRIMGQAACGFLPVVREGQVIAVVTDRDLCLALAERDQPASEIAVGEVMSGALHTCQVRDDLAVALARMREKGVRRLPVLDENRRLAGVLTLDDIALAARAFEAAGSSGPLYPDVASALQAIALSQSTPQPRVSAA